jgi:hypothetical protein
MNETRGHWFLSDALTTIVNISVNMEVEVVGLGEGSEVLDEFDLKLLTLQKKNAIGSHQSDQTFLLVFENI